MKYYIAADGGGTKLQVILYDENFCIINSAKMAGTNSVRPSEEIMSEIENLVFDLIPEDIRELEGVDICVVGQEKYRNKFLETIQSRCNVKDYYVCAEADMVLASAGVMYGVVAQAGTGSSAWLIQENLLKAVGGWGHVLGDEGSGYNIGLQTLRAALFACEGRGPQTAILDIVMKEWKITHPKEIFMKVAKSSDYKSLVASATAIAVKAAEQKDAVALSIYENAGWAMAQQVLSVIEQNHGIWEGPIVASGGAWKGNSKMFETFCEEVRNSYPEAEIKYASFEPVVGCVIRRHLMRGESYDSFKEYIEKGFQGFCIKDFVRNSEK